MAGEGVDVSLVCVVCLYLTLKSGSLSTLLGNDQMKMGEVSYRK